MLQTALAGVQSSFTAVRRKISKNEEVKEIREGGPLAPRAGAWSWTIPPATRPDRSCPPDERFSPGRTMVLRYATVGAQGWQAAPLCAHSPRLALHGKPCFTHSLLMRPARAPHAQNTARRSLRRPAQYRGSACPHTLGRDGARRPKRLVPAALAPTLSLGNTLSARGQRARRPRATRRLAHASLSCVRPSRPLTSPFSRPKPLLDARFEHTWSCARRACGARRNFWVNILSPDPLPHPARQALLCVRALGPAADVSWLRSVSICITWTLRADLTRDSVRQRGGHRAPERTRGRGCAAHTLYDARGFAQCVPPASACRVPVGVCSPDRRFLEALHFATCTDRQ